MLSSLHRSLGVLVLAGCLLLVACGGDDDEGYEPPSAQQKQLAMKTARDLYFVATTYSDLDISRGPCIGNDLPNLGPDWVVDIAHDPRRPIDDEPRNQCPKARSGQAQHFVELDPQGKVIRVR